jgi:hypothetical protein
MDDMGRVCSTHGRDEKCIHNFGRELRERLLGSPERKFDKHIKM